MTKSQAVKIATITCLMLVLTGLWWYSVDTMSGSRGYIPWSERNGWGRVAFVLNVPIWLGGTLFPAIFRGGRHGTYGWVVNLYMLTAYPIYFFAISYVIYRVIKKLRKNK